MRNLLLAIVSAQLLATTVLAQSGNARLDPPATPGKWLPVKEPRAVNSCAAYGPDYVRVEGSGMCVQISGSVSVSGSARAR